MVINFYLTRHGETQWNKIGKFQGQFDSPLTEKGLLQAESIAEQLTNKNIHLIVSSTLQLPHKLTSTLIERNFGSWQGKYIEEVKLDNHYQAIFHQVNTIAPPNGESGIACSVRFQKALINIATTYVVEDKNTNNILVVSHGDILRCFLSSMVNRFSDGHAINTQQKAFDNGCIFLVSYDTKKQDFTLISTLDITKKSTDKITT
ncbi:MAG: histidine phosphatase family protein [Colwellia sp.]|nr:histidine phosphatase family protein [Colwellia sp.]